MPLAAPTLDVDLRALQANYTYLCKQHHNKNCAGVVKANGYGLGAVPVSQALWESGCRQFFVATLEEAIELRAALPQAWIAVLQGFLAGEEAEYRAHHLTPVLNTLEQMERFAQLTDNGWQMASILHIDTGMTRLGLSHSELEKALRHPSSVIHHSMLMTHLACANDPTHPKNAEQLARFKAAHALMPQAKTSIANSAGLFLSADFHGDVGRPGCALYGISPHDGANPMQHVATLSAPILQIRTLDRDETVGYGGTYTAPTGARIAITALGYADGYLRSLSNIGFATIAGHRVPFAGRVSMDMIALDVSTVPQAAITPATRAEFINAQHTVNDVADAASTIGYEIFTRIGNRVKRVYVK